jgi:hypothetical protein
MRRSPVSPRCEVTPTLCSRPVASPLLKERLKAERPCALRAGTERCGCGL